ncbi:MAG: ATP-binding cassette domain-containing protein [Culicoidibacterales bacterium]
MRLEDVTIKYKRTCIFTKINHHFSEGTITHIIGENGSGKSTLLKAIYGAIKFEGKILKKSNRMGYVASYVQCPSELTGKELVEFYRYGGAQEKELLLELETRLKIADFYTSKYKNMSDGQKRKIQICCALIVNPELLLLDELTTGLDKVSREEIVSLVKMLSEKYGVTVINATHSFFDIDVLEGTVLQVDTGRKALVKVERTKEQLKDYFLLGGEL